MQNNAFQGTVILDSHVQRGNYRAFGAQPVAERVADDRPPAQLQNDRQLLPAMPPDADCTPTPFTAMQ